MQKEDAAQKAVASILDVLEAYLLHESFLAGHKVTLADIVAVCILQPAFAKVSFHPISPKDLEQHYCTLLHRTICTAPSAPQLLQLVRDPISGMWSCVDVLLIHCGHALISECGCSWWEGIAQIHCCALFSFKRAWRSGFGSLHQEVQ